MGIKIAILGYGFVGKATELSFNKNNDIYILDLDRGNIEDLISFNPEYTFICLPTPGNDCDTSIIEEYIPHLNKIEKTTIILKSTVLDNKLWAIEQKLEHSLIYYPEFLREEHYKHDAINPEMIVLGGKKSLTNDFLHVILAFSNINVPNKIYFTTTKKASLAKYTINTFLALKVTFFNQLYDTLGEDFEDVRNIVGGDERIGNSHTHVPGIHGRGFSGNCLPKDVASFENSCYLPILEHVLQYNENIRK